MKKILCICLSSTLQRTVTFEKLVSGQVNRSKYYREDASGKAINSARVLNQLEPGCVEVLCPLGEENLSSFLANVEKDNLKLAYVVIPGKTRECWTLLDKSTGTTTELVVSEPLAVGPEKEKIQVAEIKLLKYLNDFLPEVDAVLLAGSKPACWSEDLYTAICGIVKDRGNFLLADFVGDDLLRCLNPDAGVVPNVIKINDEEFCKTFGLKYPIGDDDLRKAVCEKSKLLGNMIVVTRGAKATYGAAEGVFAECGAESVEAVNTTACGDSFNAGFIYEFLNSGDFQKALEKGNWCGARNAERETPGAIK